MRRYLEIPFMFNGRGFHGTDCLGLVLLFYRHELGIELPDYMPSAGTPDDLKNSDFYLNIYERFERVIVPQRNDLLLFCLDGSKTPNHIGIYLGAGRFIHMIESAGCATQRIHFWNHFLRGIYRHKGPAK